DKVQFVNPALTEDRGAEQTARDHKAAYEDLSPTPPKNNG
ncbi:hypothetical protein A6R68_15279, partial [Neotoma lepida]